MKYFITVIIQKVTDILRYTCLVFKYPDLVKFLFFFYFISGILNAKNVVFKRCSIIFYYLQRNVN